MNLNDKEIYNDLNENEEKKTDFPLQTQFSTSISTPFTTPRISESQRNLKKSMILMENILFFRLLPQEHELLSIADSNEQLKKFVFCEQ